MKFVYEAADSSEGSSRHTSAIYVCIRKQGPLWMSWNQIYSCKKKKKKNTLISKSLKKWQQAVFLFFFFFLLSFFLFFHTKNSWNMACEKCARWPSYRRCRGGINLITASNIHLANISRLETQAQKWQASLAGAHNSGWQMTVIHEKRPDIYRIYREGLAIPDLWCLWDLLIGVLNVGEIYI